MTEKQIIKWYERTFLDKDPIELKKECNFQTVIDALVVFEEYLRKKV